MFLNIFHLAEILVLASGAILPVPAVPIRTRIFARLSLFRDHELFPTRPVNWRTTNIDNSNAEFIRFDYTKEIEGARYNTGAG